MTAHANRQVAPANATSAESPRSFAAFVPGQLIVHNGGVAPVAFVGGDGTIYVYTPQGLVPASGRVACAEQAGYADAFGAAIRPARRCVAVRPTSGHTRRSARHLSLAFAA